MAIDNSNSVVDRLTTFLLSVKVYIYHNRPLLDHVSSASAAIFNELKNYTTLILDPLPIILHLGEDFSNLSRTPTNHHVKSANGLHHYDCLRTPCPRDQATHSSFKRAPTNSSNWKDMEQVLTMVELSSQNHLDKHFRRILLCVNFLKH